MSIPSQPTSKTTSAARAALHKLQDYSVKELAQRKIQRRAVDAAIWGIPIVSVDAMRQAFLRDAGGRYHDIVYFSKQADWKLQITTPNASSWYVNIPISLKGGPVVVEIPPAVGAGLFGNFNDAWQVPAADVGPAGEDGGRGGKYLLIPPAYDKTVSADYILVRFSTFNGYSWLRAIPATTSPEDVAKALELVKKVRVYRLDQALNPPQQRFIDMAGKIYDGIVRFDDTFYDSLARMIDEEPVQVHDHVAMGLLKSIGIEKGKRFNPDLTMRETLRQAIAEAHADLMASVVNLEPYWPGVGWALPSAPAGMETGFTFDTGERLAIDERASLFFFGCAPAKKPGAATFYLMTATDVNGMPLSGEGSYRLRVPPNVPAKQFWAVTVYDLETCAFVRDAVRVELNSYNTNVQKNADASVDVIFGRRPPPGKESNWIATAPGKPWIAIFRFYGPEKAVFEKTWKLPDIEKTN
jgi:hypothetical protein